jgi:hypothetical protein
MGEVEGEVEPMSPIPHSVERLVLAHWPHHELTPWKLSQVDGYCHCCKRKWLARSP